MNEKRRMDQTTDRDENRDPITGAPGAHPVGTGVGAASGGAAGAAIGTAVGGPIGAGVGIVAGAIIGGLAGKGAAEAIDPTVEDAYWRENYRNRDYVDANSSYDTYRPAYKVGYEGYGKYSDRSFEDAETELQREYESSAASSSLKWNKARSAARDAWDRVSTPRDTTGKAPRTGSSGTSGTGCGCS